MFLLVAHIVMFVILLVASLQIDFEDVIAVFIRMEILIWVLHVIIHFIIKYW